MAEEVLNINHHVKILVMKALTRKPNHGEAAAALGISLRTLHRYKVQFNIKLVGGQYQIIDKSQNHEKALTTPSVSV